MILDPINSITSIDFYRKIARQSFGRSALYLAYLALLFSVTGTIAFKVKVGPAINETFQWLENSVPPLTFSGGKITSALAAPLTIRHPRVQEVALTIDTPRTEPVTPQLMEERHVMAYLASNAFYLMQKNGKIEVYDFSRAAGTRPVVLDAAFYRNANRIMNRVIYPIALTLTFLLFLLWKGCSSLVYSLVALAINQVAEAGLAYGALFNISVYAQTLVIALQGILLFMPAGIPLFWLAALVITGIYIWLAVKRNSQPAPAPA